ncbi:hypothetical protein BH10PSE1_BH10PSE1_13090 [soil metagenome]
MDLPLIPGRSCDACVECCRFIPLDLPELSKPTGSLCAYCVDAKGCSVHQVRPQTCRTWFCVWRVVDLSEDWRPDRSGIIVRPDGLMTGEITLYVIRRTEFLTSAEVFDTVAQWLSEGLRIALSIPGPVGMLPVRAEVTDYLLPAVAAGDDSLFNALVARCLDGLSGHAWEPDGIETRYAVV